MHRGGGTSARIKLISMHALIVAAAFAFCDVGSQTKHKKSLATERERLKHADKGGFGCLDV